MQFNRSLSFVLSPQQWRTVMAATNANHLKSARPNGPKRKQNPPINQPELATPIVMTDVDATSTVLTLTFDQSVTLQGTPGITTDVAGATPVSAVRTAPNVVEITFSADISAATSLNIPNRDPAIRNSSGGYVVSNVFPLAA
jgi:hypothetical protein